MGSDDESIIHELEVSEDEDDVMDSTGVSVTELPPHLLTDKKIWRRIPTRSL